MNKEYTATGRVQKLLALTTADPMREITSKEAADIMGCDVRAVAGFTVYPRRHKLVYSRKHGCTTIYRGTPYVDQAQQDAQRVSVKQSNRAAVANGWATDPDDIRIGKVVPGWRPPQMVCARAGL